MVFDLDATKVQNILQLLLSSYLTLNVNSEYEVMKLTVNMNQHSDLRGISNNFTSL